MGRVWTRWRVSSYVLVCAGLGCGARPSATPRDIADATDTGGAVRAKSRLELAVLAAVPTMSSDQPRQIGGATVVAEPAYAAASGRTCRSVSVRPSAKLEASRHLVCNDGSSWFFAPDVFGSSELQE
jgi:hypothetical protein